MQDIPLELLALILSHFPPHPRLVVVSRVCRRWRAAVLLHLERLPQTFKELSPKALPGFVALLRSCPALTELPHCLETRAQVPWAELPAWPRMSSAKLGDHDDSPAYHRWVAALPNLEHLYLFSVSVLNTPALVPVLPRLTALTLSVFEDLDNFDRVVMIPRLTSLFCNTWTWPLQFIARHASQLVQLSLRRTTGEIATGGITDICDLLNASAARFFPRLTKLNLEFEAQVDITPLLTHSPSLTQLHTSVQPALPHIRPAYADKVTRLLRYGLREAELLAYPNLRSAVLIHMPTARAAVLHTRLRHLSLVLDGAQPSNLQAEPAVWPHLETLSLKLHNGNINATMASIVANWDMPALRHLMLKSDGNSGLFTPQGSSPSAIECILARPERFPSLTRLFFPEGLPSTEPGLIRQAAPLLPRLQAMGVLYVDLYASRSSIAVAVEAQHAHPWLSLQHVWL